MSSSSLDDSANAVKADGFEGRAAMMPTSSPSELSACASPSSAARRRRRWREDIQNVFEIFFFAAARANHSHPHYRDAHRVPPFLHIHLGACREIMSSPPPPLDTYTSLVEQKLRPLVARTRREADEARVAAEGWEGSARGLAALAAHHASALLAGAAVGHNPSPPLGSATTASATPAASSPGPYRALVDVGCGYKMHGRVDVGSAAAAPVASVAVGLGVYVEMEAAEGARFCAGRARELRETERRAEEELVKVEEDLETASAALEQLRALQAATERTTTRGGGGAAVRGVR